ncbi:MAG: exo-alpha-sialidase [Cyanobacteria bacterium HKST-UBA06]|nr:exo-alpha-sialidase [Cyanobacteria bacterium HKST-UBA06]
MSVLMTDANKTTYPMLQPIEGLTVAVVPATPGRYNSFPCLATEPHTGNVVLVYRQGRFDAADDRPGMQTHGLDGGIWCVRRSPVGTWFEPTCLWSADGFEPGLIDATLSVLTDCTCLVVRRYPHAQNLFVSVALNGTALEAMPWPWRLPTKDVFLNDAHWGRVIELPDRWLMVVYGITEETLWWQNQRGHKLPVERASLFASFDKGRSWRFQSWIGPRVFMGAGSDRSANETSVVLAGSRLLALMRTFGGNDTMDQPAPLFMCHSDDGGWTWSEPTATGLYGEAPVWRQLADGRLLACYRGFVPHRTAYELGGTFCLAWFDSQTMGFGPEMVMGHYHGNHYDGGYGDVIETEPGRALLCAFYASQDTHPDRRFPAIMTVDVAL